MILDGNQYKIIVESAPNMIWRAGKDTLCDFFNAAWLRFTGKTMEQEIGDGWAKGVHPDDLDRCIKVFLDAFEKRESFEMIYRLKRHDGEYRWIHDTGVPFYDERNEFAGYIGSCLDVNEQIVGETWKTMAQKDGLTGIYNRQYFEQEARSLFDAAAELNTDMCAVMIDVDNFKYCNDHYGHQFGDKILVSFAGILKDNIRESDLLARYGGDAFILLLPDTRRQDVALILNRFKEKIANALYFENNSRMLLTFSYGVAEFASGDTFEAFIERADLNMFEEKKRKKLQSE